jgi:hypothetical protein
MKWLVALILIGGVAWLIATVPPRTAARVAARGLRAGWEWVVSVGAEPPMPAEKGPARATARLQAATPQRRATREGIVPQTSKETLRPSDREALDDLVAQPARAGSQR